MKFSQETNRTINQIRAYQSGEATVQAFHDGSAEGGDAEIRLEVLNGSFIISRDTLITDWAPQTLEELRPEHFAQLIDQHPEVVLLGAGQTFRFPSPKVMSRLIEAKIGYEVMDSGAACRTYNILAGDGRKVTAAILMG